MGHKKTGSMKISAQLRAKGLGFTGSPKFDGRTFIVHSKPGVSVIPRQEEQSSSHRGRNNRR